jgi:hypothetical protein
MTDEALLVLRCIGITDNLSSRGEIERIISAGVDWRRVLSLVRSNGVLPMFRENILRHCPDAVPRSIKARMQADFQSCASVSIGYAHELVRVFTCLRRGGVRAIAFKGPTLAQQLYGSFSLRQCQDLDILIEKNQFRHAIDVLKSAGYTAVWPKCERNRDIFLSDKHLILFSKAPQSKVELHWSLAMPESSFPLGFDDLWSHREEFHVLGSSIEVPSKEDLLLILCFHAAAHWWASLKWICDIGELLTRYPNLNWQVVLERARQLGCYRILLTGLALARDTMGIHLPEEVERATKCDKAVIRISNDVLCRFSAGAYALHSVEKPLDHIRCRERLGDRLRLIVSFIRCRVRPNECDRGWVHLPDALKSLYIVVRIVRVARLRYNVSVIPLLKTIVSS